MSKMLVCFVLVTSTVSIKDSFRRAGHTEGPDM